MKKQILVPQLYYPNNDRKENEKDVPRRRENAGINHVTNPENIRK